MPFFRKALSRLVFVDETSTNTKMYKLEGWAPRGERLQASAPFGHWKTQTFICAMRNSGLTAPMVISGAMNRERFDIWVETQLAPILSKGDIVILDNVAFHKSKKAETLIRARGAWVLFLPPYSPDLNPIEMVFAKIKTLLRKAAARQFDDLWKNIGEICDLVSSQECRNFFAAAGYEPY